MTEALWRDLTILRLAEPPPSDPLPPTLPRVVEREVRVSEADSLEVLEQIKNVPCPICGATAWGTLGQLGNLLIGLPAKTPDGDSVAAGDEWGSLDAFPFTCNRCGFVRLHAAQILTRLSEALPDEAT